jgi:hypothetical protein
MWFSVIWTSSFEKAFICSFLHGVTDFWGSLNIWVACIFWLQIPCQMHSWQRFSHILWVASSVWRPHIKGCMFSLICGIAPIQI